MLGVISPQFLIITLLTCLSCLVLVLIALSVINRIVYKKINKKLEELNIDEIILDINIQESKLKEVGKVIEKLLKESKK